MLLRKKIEGDILNSAVAQCANLCVGFLVSVIVARSLGAEGRGVMAATLLLPGITIAITLSGVTAPIVYFIASKKWTDAVIFKRIWSLATWVSILGFLVALGIYQFRDFIVGFVPERLLWLGLLMLPLSLFELLFKSVLVALRLYSQIKKVVLIQTAFQLITIGGLYVIAEISILSVISVQLFSLLVGAVVYYSQLRTRKIPVFVKYSISITLIKPAIRYGLKSHLANLAQFFNYKMDQIIIAGFLGPVSLGIYVVALGLSEKLWVLTRDVAGVILPSVSANQDDSEMKGMTVFLAKVGLYFTTVVALVLAVLVVFLVEPIYGSSYSELSTPFLILLPGVTALSFGRVLANYLAGMGFPELNMRASGLSLILNVAVSLFLTPIMGLAGAAIGTSVAHLGATCYVVYAFSRRSKYSLVNLLILSKKEIFTVKAYLATFIKQRFNFGQSNEI